MCLRWKAAGTLEAQQQFPKIIGYVDLAKLANAVELNLTARRNTHTDNDRREGRYARDRQSDHHRTAITNFHDGWDNLDSWGATVP